jgi:hypothetical protein
MKIGRLQAEAQICASQTLLRIALKAKSLCCVLSCTLKPSLTKRSEAPYTLLWLFRAVNSRHKEKTICLAITAGSVAKNSSGRKKFVVDPRLRCDLEETGNELRLSYCLPICLGF